MSSGSGTPPGWYPDVTGQAGAERYFDGSTWTTRTRQVPVTFPPRTSPQSTATQATHVVRPVEVIAVPAAERQPVPAFAPTARSNGAVAAATTCPEAVNPTLPSLLDGLAFAPAPDTAQALLRGTAGRAPVALRGEGEGSTPGWYPDPARTGSLRFFDGRRWTARTRRPVDGRKRKLPRAAQALRAQMLELADEQALRTADRPRRIRPIRVERAAPLPSRQLATRTRSGAALGMLSMLVMVTGVAASVMVAWQVWGSSLYTQFGQDGLRDQLAKESAVAGGAYDPFPVTSDPTPVTLPTATPSSTPPPKGRPAPRPAPSKATSRPALNSQPADITPWPPTGWSAPATRAVPPMPTRNGKAVGRLLIPRMGVDQVFVTGTGVAELKKGPGLWKWGAYPGTPGNTTISGHRTTYGAPFYNMDKLRYGDQIIIEIPGQPRAVYEVRGRVIASPFDVQVTGPSKGVRLTLTTCHPLHSAAQRMVVQAELVSGAWLDQAVNRSQWRVMR